MACWRGRSIRCRLSGFVETRDIRERTDRFVLRRHPNGGAACPHPARAGSAVGTKGHRAGGRQLCRIEGAAAAAARAIAARQLRFCPRHVFPGHRRLRFRDRHRSRPVEPPSAGGLSLRYAAFMQGLRDAHRRAHPNRARWRPARHRYRLADRPPRRDHHARQRCDVHFRARPRALDIGISHGRCRRRGVLCGPRAAGADSRC